MRRRTDQCSPRRGTGNGGSALVSGLEPGSREDGSSEPGGSGVSSRADGGGTALATGIA